MLIKVLKDLSTNITQNLEEKPTGFFFLKPLDGVLFDITFTNSRGGLFFKMNAANSETDDYKTVNRIFSYYPPRLKRIIVLTYTNSVKITFKTRGCHNSLHSGL